MTLYDLKLAIYTLMKQADKALPDFTFLGELRTVQKTFNPVNYSWIDSSEPTSVIALLSPEKQAQQSSTSVNSRFVETNGDRRILGITYKDRVLLEDAFKKGIPKTLYVIFYEDMLAASDLKRPISEKDWNGRFWPYFPTLSVDADAPTEEQRKLARRLSTAFGWRRHVLSRMEDTLAHARVPADAIQLSGIRHLRLVFQKPALIPGIEALFYELPVTERRPYLRLLLAEKTAISKIHLKANGQPDLEDPRLLVQWSQERSPTPGRDFALAKLLYRRATGGGIPPLYFTLRLLDDGTADITIQPPRGVRMLDPRADLDELDRKLQEGLQDLPYLQTVPQIGSGVFTLRWKVFFKSLSQRVFCANDWRISNPSFRKFHRFRVKLPF
jgi:hypothetical protein